MIVAAKEINLKNGKTLTLKSPQAEHAAILLDYLKKLFHQSYQNMNHVKNHWDNFSIEEEAKILSEFSKSPTNFMISAFFENKIVGNIACFGVSGEFLKFNSRIGMGLENEFHNIGLGTALLNYAIEVSRKNMIHRLELTVRSFNYAGIALYEKVGFRRVGLLKEAAFIDGKFCDEYIYEKIIGKRPIL